MRTPAAEAVSFRVMVLSDGPVFNMSSYQWHLRNTDGEDVVEKGADPDIPIERIEIDIHLHTSLLRKTAIYVAKG